MLWGLGRAVALEHPELRCTCIDIDPAVTDADLRSLYETVAIGESDENQIALRAGKSYALRLVRSPAADVAPAASGDAPLICREDRTYLVTGGLTGVGLRVAEHLVELRRAPPRADGTAGAWCAGAADDRLDARIAAPSSPSSTPTLQTARRWPG